MYGTQLERFLKDHDADYTWVYQGVRKLAVWTRDGLRVWELK